MSGTLSSFVFDHEIEIHDAIVLLRLRRGRGANADAYQTIALVRHIRLSISFFHHLSDKFSENWEELRGCFQILMIGLLWPKSIDSIGCQSMQQLSM